MKFSGWNRSVCILLLGAAQLLAASTFRADRVSLNGTWKFDLRRDNRLTGTGPVSFGPVSASSQAVMIAPWPGETSEGRWRTSVPWPISATIIDSEQQFWKPHPKQQGPTWWRADIGRGRVKSLRIRWVKPERVSVAIETSTDGWQWKEWTRGDSKPGEIVSMFAAPAVEARFVRVTFTPAQFEGVRKIDVETERGPWTPRIQRGWYEALRKYAPDGFERPEFNDATWRDIQVPGYWEVQKFSEPTWWQPDETVGYYRRAFKVPALWRGREVRLRFEGVNNAAQVWVNGVEVGYHESGFTQFEFDVTPHLRYDAPNSIAVRVSKWTLTHDYDTDDVWFLGGIWRDVYLYSLPATRIDDYELRTELDPQYRDAVLRAYLKLRSGAGTHNITVEGELFDTSGARVPVRGFSATAMLAGIAVQPISIAGAVPNPRKWTAETPYLYSVLLRLKADGQTVQEFRQALGFRQVEVKGRSLLVNGVPIKIRGVVTTRANPNDAGEPREKIFAREIKLLKEGNINAIRSHTTPLEEDFLDLCDRHGIYILPDVPNVWVNEYDFRYLAEGAVQRAREIFDQHKNRTSVIAWHIGNENGQSSGFLGMGRAGTWLHENDPTRPVVVCQNRADPLELGTVINDLHYYPMSHEQFRNPSATPVLFGEFHALPEEIARLKDLGFVETWGRSLQLEWAEFEKRDWVVGGLICCWDDGSVNGNLGPRQWGVVDSRRQAKAVHPHIRKVFAPVQITLESGQLAVRNRNAFTDLEGFRFRWTLFSGAKQIASGEESWRVKPGSVGRFPLKLGSADRIAVEVFDAEGYSINSDEFRLQPVSTAPPLAAKKRLPGQPAVEVVGIVIQKGVSKGPNEPIGAVHYANRRTEANTTILPFTVGDKLEGAITIEPERISYRVKVNQDVAVRECGLQIRVPPEFGRLAVNRDTLWTGTTLEEMSASEFARIVSLRSVNWVAWVSPKQRLVAVPLEGKTNLRAAGENDYVISDWLGAGDFLGKFDRDTVERRWTAGQELTGGFAVRVIAAPR